MKRKMFVTFIASKFGDSIKLHIIENNVTILEKYLHFNKDVVATKSLSLSTGLPLLGTVIREYAEKWSIPEVEYSIMNFRPLGE